MLKSIGPLFARFDLVACRLSRMLNSGANAFREGQCSDRRRQNGYVFVVVYAAHGQNDVPRGDTFQHAVEGGRGRGEKKDALAGRSGARDDLGHDARFSRARPTLQQKNVRRCQGFGHGLPLDGIQLLVADRDRFHVERLQLCDGSAQDAGEEPPGWIGGAAIG